MSERKSEGGDNRQDKAEKAQAKAVVVKKYANRRLYNTANSSYVTLDHLRDMVKRGEDFVVHDARTNEDITRSVLAQIIFEQENRGENLLPAEFLRRLIRFYGQSMQGFLPAYLEMSLESFSRSQEQLREQWQRAWGQPAGVPVFDDQARQNMALFQQAMRLWGGGLTAPTGPAAPASEGGDQAAKEAAALDELKRQMEQMQRQLDQLTGVRTKGS